MKVLLIFFVLLTNLTAFSYAVDLLSEQEMGVFIDANRVQINQIKTTQRIHLGYAVAEFAKRQIMAQPSFKAKSDNVADQLTERSVHGLKRIILSALRGIGVGGLSKTKRASARECMAGYLALYTVGINSETDPVMPPLPLANTLQATHIEKCRKIVRSARAIRENDGEAKKYLSDLLTSAAQKLEVKLPGARFGGWILQSDGKMIPATDVAPPIPLNDKEYAQLYSTYDLELGGAVDQLYRRLGAKLTFAQSANQLLTKTMNPGEVRKIGILKRTPTGISKPEVLFGWEVVEQTCFLFASRAEGKFIVIKPGGYEEEVSSRFSRYFSNVSTTGIAQLLISYGIFRTNFMPINIDNLSVLKAMTYGDMVNFIINENDYVNDIEKFLREHEAFITQLAIMSVIEGGYPGEYTSMLRGKVCSYVAASSTAAASSADAMSLAPLTSTLNKALAVFKGAGGGARSGVDTSTALITQPNIERIKSQIKMGMSAATPAQRGGMVTKLKEAFMSAFFNSMSFNVLFGDYTGYTGPVILSDAMVIMKTLLSTLTRSNLADTADTYAPELESISKEFLWTLERCQTTAAEPDVRRLALSFGDRSNMLSVAGDYVTSRYNAALTDALQNVIERMRDLHSSGMRFLGQ